MPGGERLDQSGLVGNPPPRDIYQIGRGLHQPERRGVDQLLGFFGQWAGQRDKIGLGQERGECRHRVHRIGSAPARGRVAAQPEDTHLERLGKAGEASADIAEADDQQCLAAELVLAPVGIADHAAPDAFCLVVARLGKPAGQSEDQGHRVLGHRLRVDTAGAGEPDAAPCQLVFRKLVGAGADRLDQTQFFGAVEQAVAPQPRDHQHIGLGHSLVQPLRIAHRKAGDAGAEGRKPLVQPVGDMGKADRKPVRGRKHRRGRKPLSIQ